MRLDSDTLRTRKRMVRTRFHVGFCSFPMEMLLFIHIVYIGRRRRRQMVAHSFVRPIISVVHFHASDKNLLVYTVHNTRSFLIVVIVCLLAWFRSLQFKS
ncbi:hypothetical protein RDWZM_007256 [Blomia tropicalis]|uniref:Transmembrane protein n=1 Tax=Blomia tropicalis TaxID=40697 RepID=A0A9Q0M9K6_BLOTA|nr:hypothetical protein RDWZM_007256 [Blomia tropicalis]